MRRVWLSLLGAVCVFAAAGALADELNPTQPKPALPQAPKSKIVKPAQSTNSGLADVPFSNPYAPPVGAGKSAGAEFPAAQRGAPVDPKGGMSFTYKWRATNEPFDPYWQVRKSSGPDAPGNTFMGGLKLGF